MNGKGFIDEDDFSPGYMRRGVSRLPKQSDRGPWTNIQDYYVEKDILPDLGFDDDVLVFSAPEPTPEQVKQDLDYAGQRSGQI